MTVRKIISLLLCLLSCSLSAQIETQLLMDSVIEDYQETAENEQAISDLEAMAEMLEQCYEQKIDINHADEMVLRHVLKLSDTQIYDLKSYLSLYGEMVMPYELNAIASLRKEINRILPQIEFLSSQVPLKEFLKKGFTKGMHQILIKYQQEVEPRQGYQNGDYLGKPFYMSLKYQYNYRQKVRFGLSAEKDAGELFFKGAQKAGFDFYGIDRKSVV